MKKLTLLLINLIMFPLWSFTQPVQSADELMAMLDSIGEMEEETAIQETADTLWSRLKNNEQIPYTKDDTVVFLYKGAAESVTWAGDMTGWQVTPSAWGGQKAGQSNIWYKSSTLPEDARIDYKIVLNGNNWILDPVNPHQQLSGFGWNSELRMPAWEPSPYVELQEGTEQGTLSDNKLISSEALNYQIQYRVYLPKNYAEDSQYPVMYITDGHEYINAEMGSMTQVLDNMTHQELIEPLIAVFIDPREPGNLSNNRRAEQYTCNPDFVDFVANELVPVIDENYATIQDPAGRGILGTSYGGNNAGYFGAKRPDVFGLIAPQSPAFFDQTLNLYSNSDKKPLDIFMTTGVIHDMQHQAKSLKTILENKGYEFGYIEVNEGHSWGNWRALLDDILLYFFEQDNSTGLHYKHRKNGFPAYPTQVHPGESITVTDAFLFAGTVSFYSLKGRLLHQTEISSAHAAKIRIPAELPSGIIMVQFPGKPHTQSMKLLIK